jgi:predicted aconitase with swiveling domain
MSTTQLVRARGIVEGMAIGPALVSSRPISFLGDLDIRTGMVVSARSPIHGRSLAGSVLVIPHSVGSAGAWRFLYQMFVHGTHPLAIVQQALPDSSLVQGAILASIPIVSEPDVDVLSLIHDGDEVRVDGAQGHVHVTARE